MLSDRSRRLVRLPDRLSSASVTCPTPPLTLRLWAGKTAPIASSHAMTHLKGHVNWIEVNAHQFKDDASAATALMYFASARALATTLQSVPTTNLGETSAALAGPSEDGREYTLYVSSGPLLLRVTGVAPDGDPAPDVAQVMEAWLASHIADLSQEVPASPTLPPITAGVNPTTYTIQDLGAGTRVIDINDRGQILIASGTMQAPRLEIWDERYRDGPHGAGHRWRGRHQRCGDRPRQPRRPLCALSLRLRHEDEHYRDSTRRFMRPTSMTRKRSSGKSDQRLGLGPLERKGIRLSHWRGRYNAFLVPPGCATCNAGRDQ